jgi:guanine deaminase
VKVFVFLFPLADWSANAITRRSSSFAISGRYGQAVSRNGRGPFEIFDRDNRGSRFKPIHYPGQSPIMSADLMRRAIALALENIRAGGGPFGAVLARDGRIIAEGVNRVTSANDPTAHAEVVAIREACRALGDFQLTGCDLYTTCEPCPMCIGAIYWARPARIIFAATAADAAAAGFDDAFIYDELKRPHASRRIPMMQLLRDESLSVFSAWKQQPNKTPY